MASFNLQGAPQFPVGTSVAAYPVSNWNGAEITGAPVGSATETQAVAASGLAPFVALAASTRYVAYALVNSQHRYVRFSTLTDPATTGGTGGPAVVVEAGNKTGTYAPDVGAVPLAWYELTATGNVTFAPTNWDEGTEIVVFFTQDSTPRTFSVNDGSGAVAVAVNATAGATTAVRMFGRTTTDLDVEAPASASVAQLVSFSKTGAQTAVAGTVRHRFPDAVSIVSVAVTVGTAPTGATLIVDVNKNGTTIFTTQANRPTVAISGFASSDKVPDVTAFAAGDYLTVDVDQIGSTVAGSDLCVVVKYTLV